MSDTPRAAPVPSHRLGELPLLGQFLADPHVRLVLRPVECRWKYEKFEHGSSMGFNPFRNEVYLATGSAFPRWRSSPEADLRLLNEGDLLVYEAMFVAHDYLHCWATATIQHLRPQLGFGTAPLSADNIEAMAFALLLTEAAAVVGLDYWSLSTLELDGMLGVGTNQRNLAVTYRESDLPEYQRFNPDFEVQDPEFFTALAAFYCTGAFYGFDLADARRSPRLVSWLRHELKYGQLQRRYTRGWLQHLAGRPMYPDEEALGAEVPIEEDWQVELIEQLGARLWAKVKQGDSQPAAGVELDSLWRSDDRGPLDFRFTNIGALDQPLPSLVRSRGYVKASKRQGMDQLLRQRQYPTDESGRHARAAILELRDRVELETFMWSLGALQPFDGGGEEHLRDLFFLG